jgi:Ca2+-binding RTX toxin-like protein
VKVALNGNATVVNSGWIAGNITLGIAADSLKNSKAIDGNIDLLDGADVLTNSGAIVGSVNFGTGNDDDVLNNSGTITGPISLGAGNDKVTNTGFTANFVNLGAGDDLYNGGAVRDRVLDSDGSDEISLSGGDDEYGGFLQGVAADGSDIIDGGAGNDSYLIDPEVGDLRINLDTVAHDVKVLIVPSIPVAANTAFIQDAGSDKISNFEHVTSWEGNDVIFGNASINFLNSGDGHDYLFGLGGNDRLGGGGGNDAIVGGIGADVMFGDAGIDSFLWTAINESGNTKSTRDVIKDFEDNVDIINLSLIDAFTPNGSAIDDAFVYINGNSSTTPSAMFTKVAGQGQLRSYWTTDGHIIEADVNADGKSDFSIAVYDPTHLIQFTQSDFIVS